jgi:hypothetical protein
MVGWMESGQSRLMAHPISNHPLDYPDGMSFNTKHEASLAMADTEHF